MKQWLAMLAVVALSACAPHSGGISVTSAGDVRVDNKSLARDVAVEQVQTRSVGGFLQGSALLINKDSTQINLQYKFTWYDVNGYVIDEDSSPWVAATLFGKERKQVMAVAPNAMANRFDVYVREVFSE
ncbi:YcfL family protein [Shewanella marina]|uniref:YcfL family protein n=1 Tax=Shewanella marina TaxID=487319 RepID=UPI000472CE1D|nr:YcfL family protein [Shewanella marina]